MIKNIKILAGSASFEYIINDFFKNNETHLKKHSMHALPILSFASEAFFPKEKFACLASSTMWRTDPNFTWENALMPLEKAKETFLQIKEETLIITCERRFINAFQSPFYEYLSSLFCMDASIQLDFYIFNLDISLEINSFWIEQCLRGTPQAPSALISRLRYANPSNFLNILSLPSRILNIETLLDKLPNKSFTLGEVKQEFCINESSFIPTVCKFLELAYPNFSSKKASQSPTEKEIPLVQNAHSFMLAPEIIAYINAVQAYIVHFKAVNWLSQIHFLAHNTNATKPYTYLNQHALKVLAENFWLVYDSTEYESVAPFIRINRQTHELNKKKELAECSELDKDEINKQINTLNEERKIEYKKFKSKVEELAPQKAQAFLQSEELTSRPKAFDALNIVTKENALSLGALLEKDFRQFLIAKLDRDILPYQSQSIRHVFAALLYLEEEIDKANFDKLTKQPLGTVLTGNNLAKNKPIEKPKVTVLTLAYNQENFIEKNILSVIMQKTDFPVSHIIIDDCSTDGTRAILQKYADIYPHITLILRDKNQMAFSIYAMYDQIDSPFVALCDGDDYFTHPDKLQRQVDLLEDNPDYALAFHTTEFFYVGMDDPDSPETDHTGWRTKFHPRNWPEGKKYTRLAQLLKGNLIQTNSVMYRWRFAKGAPFWLVKQITPGDWYWHILHAQNGKIGFDPEVMSAYVRHPQGIFAETAHSVAKHTRKFGKQEIHFFETINLHFEDRYKLTMRNGQASVFVTLGRDAMEHNDYTHYLALCKAFPYLCEEFDINVERVEMAAELTEVKKKLQEKKKSENTQK